MRKGVSPFMIAMLFIATFLSLQEFVRGTSGDTLTQTPAQSSGPAQPSDLEEAKRLNAEAVKLYREGKLSAAIDVGVRGLKMQEKILGPYHPDLAVTVNNLAFMYQDKGDNKKAESHFRRALAIREKLLGPDHADVVPLLNNLAEHYSRRKKFNKAEPLYIRALSIREKLLGPDHPDIAWLLDRLATNYFLRKKLDKAEPLFLRALSIREKAPGPDQEDVVLLLEKMVQFYCIKEEYEKAESIYLRSLAIRVKTHMVQAVPAIVDSPPIPLNRPRPDYTEKARQNKVEGTVIARALIGADGIVKIVRLIQTLPHGLGYEAMRAIYRTSFKPAIKDGQAVPYWQKIVVEFNLR